MTEVEAVLHLVSLGGWSPYIIAIGALAAALLPPATPRSPAWWKAVRRAIDVIGCNVRNAKNR